MTKASVSAARGAGVQVGDGTALRALELAKVIAKAVEPLEPCKYLVPEPRHRLAVMTRFFELRVKQSQHSGSVQVTADQRGVAVWTPQTGEGPGGPEQEPSDALAKAAGQYAERFTALSRVLASHYPAGRAFEHLVVLAVHPSAQRHGLGSALLAAHHARLDAEGIPAYAEAASLALTGFFQRHGYLRLEGPIVLPDGRQIHPMWREPHEP